MNTDAIAAYLQHQDANPGTPRPRAVSLRPRIPGGSRPWDCEVEGGGHYIVKCQNNPQDARMGRPLKFLTTDLVCGRLGQLFEPPVCPPVEIIDVPPEVANGALHPASKRHPAHRPIPGPSFGSQLVDAVYDLKAGGGDSFDAASLQQMARLITFYTWLRGVDVSALVTRDGRLLSIDHGYFLTVYRWDNGKFGQAEEMKPKVPSQWRDFQHVAKRTLFEPVLHRLLSVPEDEIVRAFADIPNEWGVSLELRTKAAAYVLHRRDSLSQALSVFNGG